MGAGQRPGPVGFQPTDRRNRLSHQHKQKHGQKHRQKAPAKAPAKALADWQWQAHNGRTPGAASAGQTTKGDRLSHWFGYCGRGTV
jgi:hypothetical protein